MDSELPKADKGSPPFVSGGGGFEYEDHVAAFILAAMLAGQPPLGEGVGLILRIDWQVAKDGWEFDDLLLTRGGPQDPRLALSCKSGAYVTGGGWPPDAVERLWRQWTRPAPSPFRRGIDLLGVVTGSLAHGVDESWDRLVQEAIMTDPVRFMARFGGPGASGQTGRDLVESLQRPSSIAGSAADEPQERAELIRHLRLWRRELMQLDSADSTRAVEWCRQSLADGDREKAAHLLESLRSIAAERRIRGGTLELRDLIALLSGKYVFRDWPADQPIWQCLESRSGELMRAVGESLGDMVCLTQVDVVSGLLKHAAPGRVVLIDGESGTGKSALAKRMSRTSERLLWLSAQDLEAATIDGVAAALGVSARLLELIDRDRVPRAVLVIDGAERLSAAGRRNAARLAAAAVGAARPWLVVVTSQEDGTERLIVDLRREHIDSARVRSVRVALPDEALIGQLLPSLSVSMAPNPSRSLLRALRNLKALDWSVRSATQKPLAGFPDLVEQVWNGFLGDQDRAARASVLKAIARADADVLTGGVPRSLIRGAEDQRVAERLVADGLLLDRNERLFFRHDLLGDWARLLLLVESGEEAPKMLSEVAGNIRWTPAIRLYGEWLSQEGETERKRLVSLLVENPSHPAFLALIEGLCRSPSGAESLGEALTEFGTTRVSEVATVLRTFLAVATRPSDLSLLLRRDHPVGAAIRATHRVPIPELWPGVVSALEKRTTELAGLLPAHVGDITRVWLLDQPTAGKAEYSETTMACAKLAVAAAKEIQARLAVAGWGERDEDTRVFEGLLLAAPWLPEEVAQVSLELSRRRPDPQVVVDRVEAERKRVADAVAKRVAEMTEKERTAASRRTFSIGPTPRKKRKPFADGPSARVDEAFRNAVLNTGAIIRLAEHKPEAAQEVLLACCLEDPGQDDPLYADFSHDDHAGTVDKVDWFPPWYGRGPWLALLLRSPEQGLEAVMRLVGAGTREWLRLCVPRTGAKNHDWVVKWSTVVLDVAGTARTFRGGAGVFGWYRGYGHSGNVMASALMALEHWLYRCIDAGEAVDCAVRRILESGDSVALLGVLAALGRHHPNLLNGVLLPHLSSWMLLDWDANLTAQARMPEIDLAALGLKLPNTWIDDEAEKWSKLPHRVLSLPWIVAAKLALGETEVIAACEAARVRWQAEIDSGTCLANEEAKRLIALLNPANLSVERQGEQVTVAVKWPPELAAKYEERGKQSGPSITAFHLRKKMRELLDADHPLTDSQADAIWQVAQSLEDVPGADGGSEMNSPASARAAAGAVLEVLAGEWLDKNPEPRAWCEKAVLAAASDHRNASPFGSGVSRYKEHTEGFTGVWGVARLAAGDARPEVRRVVARAMTAEEPVVIGQVLTAAVGVGEKLPDDLDRLFNLLWLWAALRSLSPGGTAEGFQKTVAEARRRKLIEAFVTKRLPNADLPWADLRLRAARASERDDRRRHARAPSWRSQDDSGPVEEPPLPSQWEEYSDHGFNWSVLEHVIQPLPVVVRPSKGTPLRPLVEFDRRLLDLVLFAMQRARQARNGDERLPQLFDRCTLGRLCLLLASHEEEQLASDVWSRLAPLLASRPKWCEAFFDSWFRQPRKEKEQAERFHRRWRSMIETARGMPEWEANAERWSHDRGEVWSALLGVHERGSKLGIEEDSPYMRALESVYAGWAKRALAERWRLRSFCDFLQKPGAAGLHVPALEWVRTALEALSFYVGRERELVLEAAAFCIVAWHQHRDEILTAAGPRDAFVWIVQLLSRMRVQEIADVKEELEAAVGPNPE